MTTTATTNPATEVANEILNQLGANKFIAMTGSKNFISDTNEKGEYSLRMDLRKNEAKVNRLCITLNLNDTYTMEFYNFRITKELQTVITNAQTFEGVQADQLQTFFTKVTGYDTHL